MKMTWLALCSLLIAPAAFGKPFERQVDAAPKGEVEIVNVSGEVKVIGWARAQVQVEGDLGEAVERVEFERNGDHTLIAVKLEREHGSGGSSDLVVHVPQGSSLFVKTVSADQTIENVRGEQRLQSVNGGIRTQVWAEEFEAKSVNGEINVHGQGQQASTRIRTVSGSVQVDNIGGELELNTVNGSIRVDAGKLTRARINSTNGPTQLVGTLLPDGRVEAEAINGHIELLLRGAIDAEFDLETFNGEIDNCFGPEPIRTSKYAPGKALRFQEGDGSARVRIKTLNGGIEVCRKK